MSLRSVALAVADLLIGNQRWPLSPPNLTAGADYDPHDQFNTDLAALVGPLDVALIDFSGARPLIAMSSQPDHTTLIASLAKLAILYAAFQVRQDVRDVLRKNAGIRSATALKAKLREFWAGTSSPHRLKEIARRPDVGRIEYILDLSELSQPQPNPDRIDFLGIAYCGLDQLQTDFSVDANTLGAMRKLDGFPHSLNSAGNWRNMGRLTFAERLWMTIAWSDNVAASTCIWDIGLPYIQALMYESGLFDGSHGLYLTRNFIPSPPEGHGTRFGSTHGHFPPTTGTSQRGSVQTLAALMKTLVTNLLISETASMDMKRFLRPVKYTLAEGHPITFNHIGNTRVTDALGNIVPQEALIKGGAFDPEAIVCDWEYLELGGSAKVGVIVLNAVQPTRDEAENALGTFVQAAEQKFPTLFGQ